MSVICIVLHCFIIIIIISLCDKYWHGLFVFNCNLCLLVKVSEFTQYFTFRVADIALFQDFAYFQSETTQFLAVIGVNNPVLMALILAAAG